MLCCVLMLGASACSQNTQQQQQQQQVSAQPAPAEAKKETPKKTDVKKAAPQPQAPKDEAKKEEPVEKKTPEPEAPEPAEKPAPDAYTLAKSAALTAAKLKRQMGVAAPLRISRVPMEGKYVALTFDDGPSKQYTTKVLDVLKKYDAKGTFFVLGNRLGSGADIVKRADAEGHEIGVHTWSHINMRASSYATVSGEMERTTRRIFDLIGKYPKIMRPPYGSTSTSLVNNMYDHFAQRSIMWDVDTQDWRKPGVETVIHRAVNRATPGSIVLVHDIHGSTFAALEGIVKGLQNRGFKLVTVSELMALRGCKAEPKPAENKPEESTSATVSQEQPQPGNQAQPQPVNQEQPQPVNQEQPQPANQEQPMNDAKEAPAAA